MTERARLDQEIRIAMPVRDVFAAWASADELAKWFAPMAIKRPEVELAFRVAGRYVIRMTLAGNRVLTTTGEFQEIVANEKIVMTWQCDAFPDATTVVSVLFLKDGAGTIVKVSHINFESAETCANHKHGWDLCLAKLRDLLEK